MGYSSVILLGAILVISSFILLNHTEFPPNVVTAAGAALFGDVLGLVACVWKIVLNPHFMTKLEPATSTIGSYEDLLHGLSHKDQESKTRLTIQQRDPPESQ